MAASIELVRDFLAQRRIAVAGVSRDGRQASNVVFRRLRDTGHVVVPVNPATMNAEGMVCYPDLKSIPGSVDGVMVVTSPPRALEVVRECAALGIARVWMHRSFGAGSVSDAAVEFCRAHDIAVIDGGCPLMYGAGVDPAHACMRWLLALAGKAPR